MGSLELWDNLIQLTATLAGGLYLLFLFQRTARRCFVFLAGAQLGWALGLLYYVLYIALRGYPPVEPNPSQFVWSGAHLLYLSVIHSLMAGRPDFRRPGLAFLAPALTLPFTLAWFLLGDDNSPIVSLLWGLGLGWIALESAGGLLLDRAAGRVWHARYHAAVLLMILFDEFVLFSGLFYTRADYLRLNWYYLMDLLVTLALMLQVYTLKKAEAG